MPSASPTIPVQRRQRFYTKRDWLAAVVTGVLALVGYGCTLAPTVTFNSAGELTTVAFQLGVAHPPGVPLWTFSAWLWCHLLPVGNIAWRLNLFSAVTGAAACGLVALLVSKSGRMIGVRTGVFQIEQDRQVMAVLVPACAICAGLLLAFSPVLWSAAVVTETAGFDALGWMATLVVLYRWSFQPENLRRLYLAAGLWGASVTTDPTLALLAVAGPAFVWFMDRQLGRALLAPMLGGVLAGILRLGLMPSSLFYSDVFPAAVLLAIAAGAGYWLRALWRQGPGWMDRWPHVSLLAVAVSVGWMWAGGLVLVASTNPPINWGDCTHWSNWLRHLTGGLFDKLQTGRTLWQGWGHLNLFFYDLQMQFNIVFALLVLPVVFFYRDLVERDRQWIKFLLLAFLCLGFGYLFLANPVYDQPQSFTTRDYFLPGDCLYAVGIGYGLLLGLGQLFLAKPRLQVVAIPLAGLVLVLPAVSLWRNGPHVEQHEHDFAYRFGYLLFEPGGDYPPLERKAVLFGGTDDNRFLAAHMIFVESRATGPAKSRLEQCPDSATFDRRDVYLLTQNALTDPAYLPRLRDQYGVDRPRRAAPATWATRNAIWRTVFSLAGRDDLSPPDPLWLPANADVQRAYNRYLTDFRRRAPLPGETVVVDKTGRVHVTGLPGIMAVNGLLARDIFEHNKDQHPFYVAESQTMSWMQPYLEPFGLIFKLHPEPLVGLLPAVVARDKAYWDALSDVLLGDPRFRRDTGAQKFYSQLRTATAGLYASRQMWSDAEYAFLQALALCPDNPDANYRFAQFYVDRQRCNDALELLEAYRRREPRNPTLQQAIAQVTKRRTDLDLVANLERQHALYPEKLDLALQLARAYAATQRLDAFDALVNQLLTLPDLPEREFFSLIDLNSQLKRADPILELLGKFTQRYPQNPIGWFNLALMHGARGNCADALPALERALALDPQLAVAAQKDRRLENCRSVLQTLRVAGPPLGTNSPALPTKVNH